MIKEVEKKLKRLGTLQTAELGVSTLLIPAGALVDYHLLNGNGAIGFTAGLTLKGIVDYGTSKFVEAKEKFLSVLDNVMENEPDSQKRLYKTLEGMKKN